MSDYIKKAIAPGSILAGVPNFVPPVYTTEQIKVIADTKRLPDPVQTKIVKSILIPVIIGVVLLIGIMIYMANKK